MSAQPTSHLQVSNDDPFGERTPGRLSRRLQLLGCCVEFRSDSEELLGLVDSAYSGLPAHRMPITSGEPDSLLIELRLTEQAGIAGMNEPPEPRMQGGAGFVCALMDAANLALAFPEARRGLVAVSREMLRCFPYHARYELIEFLVFTLASRSQGLVPLHAGCVGLRGRGALLVGESGAGKSTLSLHCMLQGLDFLTEDASFVAPQDLSVTGVANFLHLRFDSLAFLDDAELRATAQQSPVIRRRSGVEKYELDLRQGWARIAPAPLKLEHIVLVSPQPAADGGPLLTPLAPDELLARLTRSQPYAAQQPGWPLFVEQISSHLRGHHQLRRGSHPREAAEALRGLLVV